MKSSVYVAIPLFLGLAVLQTAVLPYFPLFGAVVQLLLLVVVSWTLLHGLEEGLVWAFVAGLCIDLFSIGPMGATALAYITAVLVVAGLESILPPGRFFMPVLYAALSTIVVFIIYLPFVRLLGFGGSFGATADFISIILLNAGFMLPVYWLVYSIDRAIQPRRVEV